MSSIYIKPSQSDINPSCLQEILDLLETYDPHEEAQEEAKEILNQYGVIFE